jgi:hypothetical protein
LHSFADVRRDSQSEFATLPNSSSVDAAGDDYLLDNDSSVMAGNGVSAHPGHLSPALVNGKSRTNDKDEQSDSTNMSSTLINADHEDQMEAFGYRTYRPYVIGIWILYILTLGMLRLIFHWRPQWRLYLTHVRCSLVDANRIMLIVSIFSIFFKLN